MICSKHAVLQINSVIALLKRGKVEKTVESNGIFDIINTTPRQIGNGKLNIV